MKVTMEKNYKDFYTVNDVARAKEVIRSAKEDTTTAKEYLLSASRMIMQNFSDCPIEALTASASTAKNGRINNFYGDDTGWMDVWIEGIVKTCDGFIEVGAYLTDIYNISSITDSADFARHTYFQYYGKTELR